MKVKSLTILLSIKVWLWRMERDGQLLSRTTVDMFSGITEICQRSSGRCCKWTAMSRSTIYQTMMHFFLRTERNVGHGYGKKGKKSKMGCHKMKLQKWEILPLKRVKNKREMVNCYPEDLCLSVRPLGPPQCNIFTYKHCDVLPYFCKNH